MLRAAGRLARGRHGLPAVSENPKLPFCTNLVSFFSSETGNYALVKDSKVSGLAEDVLRLVPDTRPAEDGLKEGTVLMKILAAPINPADISCIEGRYPLHPDSEEAGCHPGFEGVGVVEAVGPGVTRFKPGDVAVPIEAFQGTWRTFAAVNENHWCVLYLF